MGDLVGRLVGRKYRILDRLGSGGVADVYEAVHEEIGQRFALKVLKREFAAYPEVADRFLTEARASSAVRHPGIVQIFDYGRLDDETPYLAMELLQGENLNELMLRRRKVPFDQAVGVCIHVLDALDAAHRAGVVHRDLKPENVVLVRGPGGEPWAKIIDFGIARLAREGPGAMRLTAQGTVMGTPYYMSPEQARGAAAVDGRSDIYAVGVMLFEMIAGKLPFEGANPSEVLTKVLTEPFPSLCEREPSAPKALEDVVLRATARKPDARYATAAEFAEALRPLRPELVAVQILTPEEEADLETTATLRLQELAVRSGSGRGPLITPTRISTPPRLPGQPGRPHSPPQGTFGVRRLPSITPPPIRRQSAGITLPRNTIVVSRWAVFLGAVLGIAAAAAAIAALLVVLSGRDAAPADVPLAQAADLGAAATAHAKPDPTPPTAAATADLAAPEPVAAPAAPPPAPPTEAAIATEPPPPALIRLVGLPPGAAAIVDDRPVEAEFHLAVSGEQHVLRVEARGRRPFVHTFRVEGDATIEVALERARPVPTPATAGPGHPTAYPAPTTGGPAEPRPLANPFESP